MIHARHDYDGIQDTTGETSIEPDEPVFIIRAKDQVGANAVRFWADQARMHGAEARTVAAVMAWADRMDAYRSERFDGGKIPDVPPGRLFTEDRA